MERPIAGGRIERGRSRAVCDLVPAGNREAVPYDLHTILTDNGIQFADLPKNRDGWTARMRVHRFDQICREHGRRLKTLRGLTPYEYVARVWTENPTRFKVDPYRYTTGLNTQSQDLLNGLRQAHLVD